MDYLHNFLKWLDYNRYTAISIALAVGLVAFISAATGCHATGPSIITPEKQVTRVELQAEIAMVDALIEKQKATVDADYATAIAMVNSDIGVRNATVALTESEIERKEALQQAVADFVQYVAATVPTGTLNPYALIPAIIGILGLGYGIGKKADILNKDAVIARNKAPRRSVSVVNTDPDEEIPGTATDNHV